MENILIERYLYQDIGPLTWNHFQDVLLYSLNLRLKSPPFKPVTERNVTKNELNGSEANFHLI